MDDSWIPSSPGEWYRWLSAEERKTRQAYLAKPATLISDYNKEIATTRDYEAREILELLQNAADQAREASVKGKVVVDLQTEGLIVANTGAAFSVGGVASLQTAHLSPKRRRRRQFIGNKGLGFRSVLNWSHSPIILSGSLALAYQSGTSNRVLIELCQQSEELAELVAVERTDIDEKILPLLPFPGYSVTNDLDEIVKEGAAHLLLSHCRTWSETGYTTAIGMPFDRDDAHQAAWTQLENLRPEILLFVDHLNELRFVTNKREERVWRLEGDDVATLVTENGEPLGIWQVFRSSGVIPEEELGKDQSGPLDYELVVAVPELEKGDEPKSSPLFSHFPTEINLPLPLVCHATLELEQNRKHPQQRKSNTFVLKRLAQFLTEVAETRAKHFPQGLKAGFRLLLELESYPLDLTRENFKQHLITAASQKAIVPTLGGTAVYPDEACTVPGADASWLPAEAFTAVVPVSGKTESEFFDKLGVPALSSGSLKERLSGLDGLSLSRRAALIAGLLQHRVDKSTHTSALLVDSESNQVPDQTSVFIAPSGSAVPKLPNWMALRFLNEDLRLELAKLLETKEARDLQNKLSSFDLLEYSLANLIRRLIAAANKQKKKQSDSIGVIDRDLIETLFALYRSEGHSGKRPEFPDLTVVSLPNQAGKSAPADTLYLGEGYGTQGAIIQALYGHWAPERLVAIPAAFGLSKNAEEVRGFLVWLKVAGWPREEIISDPSNGYLEDILVRIIYPARFEEYEFKSRDDLCRAYLANIRSVSGLSEILDRADPTAIAAWLAKDERAYGWSRRKSDNAELTAIRGCDRNPRRYREPIPGYIRWKIEKTAWLPDENGDRLRPKDCVLGERAIEAIFPRPAKPDVVLMSRFGMSDRELYEGLGHAGVVTSLSELELDDVYDRLMEMPERQPDGKSARSLYRWFLDISDKTWGHGGAARERFFKEGRMWGRFGNTVGYFPVTQLQHADIDGLPDALLNHMKIVDLPHRVGAEKVKRVFGVQSIDRIAIQHRVKNSRFSVDLDPDFQSAKPYLFLLRASQTSQTQNLNHLKALHLKVCSELLAEIEYAGETFEFQPPVWGWLIDIEENFLYVRSDPAEPVDIASDLLADAIGEAIASIFRLADGGEFARMFLCKDKDRKTLLRRMRGETADEDMDKIMEEFGSKIQLQRMSRLPKSQTIFEPLHLTTDAGAATKNKEPMEQDEADVRQPFPGNEPDVEPLSIEPIAHEPKPPAVRQDLRIRKTVGRKNTSKPAQTVTDGDFAERKTMEFEGAADPPRFPLRVGQLTGNYAVGCDVLSFASEQTREDFRTGADRDFSKVLRFIEVKGRKSESVSIELRGNERSAAVEYGDRYYLYRLYESGSGEFVLSMLKNPLAQKEALEPAVYVDLDRAERTERFEITGGLRE